MLLLAVAVRAVLAVLVTVSTVLVAHVVAVCTALAATVLARAVAATTTADLGSRLGERFLRRLCSVVHLFLLVYRFFHALVRFYARSLLL